MPNHRNVYISLASSMSKTGKFQLTPLVLQKDKNQASIPSLLKGSIGSRYIITRPQKWSTTHFLGLLTPFFSKTRANSLLPSPNSDSTGKNLSQSVMIGQVPKSMSDSDY